MAIYRLPTPIQAEAVPLILGGGDVMAAAETGSGKTGAFSLPVLQIVHETLALNSRRTDAISAAATSATTAPPSSCRLNPDDRDDVFAIGADGLTCQARSERSWGGCRATVGVFTGKVYYEATVRDEGLCRLGWSTVGAGFDVGTEKGSFGFGGTGKKSHDKQFTDYGEAFGLGDTVGCWLDCVSGGMGFSKNGISLGVAFTAASSLAGQPLFPAVSLKNAELVMNFGSAPMKFPPPAGFVPMTSAPEETTVTWAQAITAAAAAAAATTGTTSTGSLARKPLALILEPARDLAEQTFNNVSDFAKHLKEPAVRAELLVGGMSAAQQVKSLKQGVDLIVGTPGRVVDLMERGELSVDQVKFFVLDEADRLLDTGNREAIMKLFRRLPKSGTGAARLQVLLFSATLHSPEIRTLASQICENPVVVDLKGKDAVPDSVDHVIIKIDPAEDRTWLQSEPRVDTDGVHVVDPPLAPTSASKEAWSEAVKRLKPRLLVRLLDSLKAEQALVFCRTNHDCDNLERFLNRVGGTATGSTSFKGGKRAADGGGPQSEYSCLVLAGARSMEERRAALSAFKESEVRVLISTDVAARGIDIQGLPLVVNMTLPDKSEDYVHRVGRVGRADAIGLAVSLVATVPEKVWYCTQKGLKPWLAPDKKNTRSNEQGGHTLWMEEEALLKGVEQRLGSEIAQLPADLTLPPLIAARVNGGGDGDGKKYGQDARGGEASAFAKEVAERAAGVAPSVATLAALEHQAQASFFMLKRKWAAVV